MFFLQIQCLHFYQLLLTCRIFLLLLIFITLTDLVIEMKLPDVLFFFFLQSLGENNTLQKEWLLLICFQINLLASKLPMSAIAYWTLKMCDKCLSLLIDCQTANEEFG